MDKSKELTLRKPNEIIEVINRPLSVMGWNAYNFILTKLQETKTSKIIISPAEILTAIGATNLHEELYKCLDELQKTQVSSIDKRGKSWGGFVLLSAFKKNEKGLYLEIPQLIADTMFKNEDLYYTTIKLLEEKAFKCSYSLVFYEIFKRFEKVSIPEYTLDILRKMTKTENKYKIYYDFKKRVLTPALKEINSFDSRYIYSFEEEYLGRRVEKIRFSREEKSQQENPAQQKLLPELSDKLIKAIEKARKNRFIQEKYSQRAVNKAIEQFGEELVIKGLIELYKFQKPINSFSKILNAKIDDLNKLEIVKKTGTKHQDEVENAVISEITGSKKLQDEEKTLDELIEMASTQGMTNLPTEQKLPFCTSLLKVKTKEELKKICDKYNILLNLKLF